MSYGRAKIHRFSPKLIQKVLVMYGHESKKRRKSTTHIVIKKDKISISECKMEKWKVVRNKVLFNSI